jgi:hypothetical protein
MNQQLVTKREFLKLAKSFRLPTKSEYFVEAYAESANEGLQRIIDRCEVNAESEEGKVMADVRKGLYKAASNGAHFQYPRGVQSMAGVEAEYVDAQAEVQAYYKETIDNLVRPRLVVLSTGLIEERTLADNEMPQFTNVTGHATKVYSITTDGKARTGNIVKAKTVENFDEMDLLTTEDVSYNLMDLIRGSVEQEMTALVDLSNDLLQQQEAMLWAAVNNTTVFAAFNFSTGKPELRTMNIVGPNAASVIANIPTTNLIALTAAGGPSDAVVKAFVNHFSKFGGVLGGAKVKTLIYPSGYGLTTMDSVAVTTASGPLNEQVVKSGYVFDVGGTTVNYLPAETMSKALKRIIGTTGKPVGILFRKPGFDQIFEEKKPRHNKGYMAAQRAVKLVMPAQWRVNAVAATVEA